MTRSVYEPPDDASDSHVEYVRDDQAFWKNFKASVGVGKIFHICKMVVCLLLAVALVILGLVNTQFTIGFAGVLAAFFLYASFTSAKLLFWDAYRY